MKAEFLSPHNSTSLDISANQGQIGICKITKPSNYKFDRKDASVQISFYSLLNLEQGAGAQPTNLG